jgi:HD-GYP domain-containing protein (c-di-GMP phosphodiesterase class II)
MPDAVLAGSSIGKTALSASTTSGELEAARQPLRLQRAADFSGHDALHLGVPLKDAPWVLVETVPAQTALAGVDARIRSLVVILLLGLLAIIAAILALWRHNAGLRAVEAREERVKLYRGVVDLLLQAIDQRDPGAAAHSRRVASLSRAMALGLRMSSQDADTVELCGALLNVGKLFVPASLLTKAGGLDEAEREQFAQGGARWLDLLAKLPRNPPLEPTLRQAHALIQHNTPDDGQYSQGAYIIVAANSAVALMSGRSYRGEYSANEALNLVMETYPSIPPQIVQALREALHNGAK